MNRWIGEEREKRADAKDLVSKYPTHIPMGLPLPTEPAPDKPDEEYSL